MKDRQKRLTEVYEYLRQKGGIHTKTQFAEAIGFGRTSMSAALNGKEVYLTDSLFKSICKKYPEFNIDYLLEGVGSLVSDHPTEKNETIDNSSLVNALLAAKDETISALESKIKTLEELIESLRQNISDLRQQMAAPKPSQYPFEMGVAENDNINDRSV